MTTFDDQIRARIAELDVQVAAINADLQPVQAERDELLAKYAPRERELARRIKELRGPLYDLEQERARLFRALPGTISLAAESNRAPGEESKP